MSDPLHTRWLLPDASAPSPAAEGLALALHLPLAIARILVCRGFEAESEAEAFLRPTLAQLHDPRLLLGMDKALVRIRLAITNSEPILIYGDYDVDGTVATVLLKTALERAATALGHTADVRYHIPHRIREGYGIADARLAAAAAEGVRLVISVDTGIRAFSAGEEALRLGLDLIVTDHHLPDALGVPQAVAVINPNQRGCPYPFKELCGAAVAFKLAQALLEDSAPDDAARTRLREKTLPSFLKLLAIATIADAVPLTGENRVIASLGLRELQRPSQSGLRALMELAAIDTADTISATDVGFRLAPRINAAGRMDIASDVVDMFLERDPAAARKLAEKLHRLNDERRAVEAEALRAIEARIEATPPEAWPPIFVFDDEQLAPENSQPTSPPWHRGVIGILASRVVDRTGRPALVLAHEDDGLAYGSGRSVAGFHLLDAITAAHMHQPDAPLFSRFGGHAHAVGFALPSAQVAELRTRMEREAAPFLLAAGAATDSLDCDAELRLDEITPDFLAAYEKLGPFGHGNREPVFTTHRVTVASALKTVKERHLRIAVHDPTTGARLGGMAWGRRTDWVAFAAAWGLQQGSAIDLAFRLNRNRHPDFGGWEMEVLALRPSAPSPPASSPPSS